MYETEIRIRYASPSFARAVKNALSPDDKIPNSQMIVSTKTHGQTIIVQVKGCEKIETMQLTMQDIFRCIQATETLLKKIAKS
ncbi:MAG: KEOPS complex subunit Pcc1 [Candidatus Bathyarchaeia archaeon]|jgi:tRNA threonylcarbamoyladenosine modification (KEOPS) complex  Pcc1 subunit